MATRKKNDDKKKPRELNEPRAAYRAVRADPHREKAVTIIAEEIARAYGSALKNLSQR
jgi:hypothetical protein